jgi:hypothetical protein
MLCINNEYPEFANDNKTLQKYDQFSIRRGYRLTELIIPTNAITDYCPNYKAPMTNLYCETFGKTQNVSSLI